MTIRTLLVPLAGSENMTPVMELGLALGKDLGVHVDVLHIQSDPKDTIPLLGEGMSVSMIEDMIQIAETEGGERASEGRQVFDKLVAELGIGVSDDPNSPGASAAWSEDVGRNDEITARRGRLAVLIVVPRPTASSDVLATLTLNAALFDSGRPVLVTPPGDQGGASKPFSVGGHVAISWNGSAEAARSVGSAMGLISKADKVTVLTVDSDRTSAARAPELADYLEWHGVVPDTRTFSADSGPSIGEALLAECGTLGVDLLVMGAYTHSRVRQLILGGVTRHVLEQATLPLFMAH
ncbi:MAG: universal stress protein [Alphaproteobacteria bacterium]|nr:universal stress protein [Alphaproteobacteria bacterium]